MGISDFKLKDMVETTRCGRSLSHNLQEKKVFRKGEPGEGQARFSKEKDHIIQCLDLRVHMKERYFSGCRDNQELTLTIADHRQEVSDKLIQIHTGLKTLGKY